MNNIGSFFDKFRNKATDEIRKMMVTMEILKKHTGITFDMKDIAISRGILRIKSTPLQKNVIFMKKERILKEIEEKLGKSGVYDIQF